MAGVTIIIVHRVLIVRPRYLLYFIHSSMHSAMQQIGYDHQIRFDYRLSQTRKMFLLFHQHMRYLKREREESFY